MRSVEFRGSSLGRIRMGDVKGGGIVDDGVEGSSGDLLSHSFIRTWTHKGKRTCDKPQRKL
jgi:hypothetical protein